MLGAVGIWDRVWEALIGEDAVGHCPGAGDCLQVVAASSQGKPAVRGERGKLGDDLGESLRGQREVGYGVAVVGVYAELGYENVRVECAKQGRDGLS